MIKVFGGFANLVNVQSVFDDNGDVEITSFARITAADEDAVESIKKYLFAHGYVNTASDEKVMKQIQKIKVLG